MQTITAAAVWSLLSVLSAGALAGPAGGGVRFAVKVDPALQAGAVGGRLIVSMVAPGAKLPPNTPCLEAPFWDDLQPIVGVDAAIASGGSFELTPDSAGAFWFPANWEFKPGEYRAAARLDRAQTNSSWRREPGNLWSDEVTFTVKEGAPSSVELVLNHRVEAEALPKVEGVRWFELKSPSLSAFHGRDVVMHAGVVFPKDFDPKKKYATVYEVPGFGGDHQGARGVAQHRAEASAGEALELAKSCFWIVLDPESGNGHTLFCDSANNGPCGQALVKELIPALEAAFPLAAKPEARLLRGHSSGGWTTLWLATEYPETFGACWSSSPDPVDFRFFQLADIYADANMYVADAAMSAKIKEVPGAFVEQGGVKRMSSLRHDGVGNMSAWQENMGEEVMGADNTSGGQWDSWMAVWGPRNERGHPAALFDPKTGAIDHALAETYRRYDIVDRLFKNPAKYGPLFKSRIRLLCGGADNFFLDRGVASLKKEVDKLSFMVLPEGSAGYITLVPGKDHGTIFGTPEMAAFPGQMLTHLREHALLP